MLSAEAQELQSLLERGVAEAVFPAAAAFVASEHRPRAIAYAGRASAETLWDVASLTKPMAVVTPAMGAVARGQLALDERVAWPPGVETTVRALLAHRSGLPPWDDLWAAADDANPRGWRPGSPEVRAAVEARIGDLAGSHTGTAYSDLGFITLGWHLERRLGVRLDDLGPGRWGPLTEPNDLARAAPTAYCERRGEISTGVVDDLNCWVLGGVAGHAGLFATVSEVGSWALDLARAAAGQTDASIDAGVVNAFWDLGQRDKDETWVLGWDTPSATGSSAGRGVGPRAVGHLGFTGTSVWIERDHGLVTVLLTNRVANGPDSRPRIKRFRPDFHDSVRAVFGR